MRLKNSFGNCSKCGKQIMWIKTKAGKSMPCNPSFVYYKEQKGRQGQNCPYQWRSGCRDSTGLQNMQPDLDISHTLQHVKQHKCSERRKRQQFRRIRNNGKD